MELEMSARGAARDGDDKARVPKKHELTERSEAKAVAFYRSWKHECCVVLALALFTAGYVGLFTAMGVGVAYTLYAHDVSNTAR